MSALKLIPEEKAKVSPRITESVYSGSSSVKLQTSLRKRKILQPLVSSIGMAASANMSRNSHVDRRNIAGRVLSAKEHRLKQLQNQLTDAQYHLNELYRENRLLKSIQKRQDSALQRYESENGDIPKLINSHNEELRSLQVRYKQIKLQFREVSQKMKDKECELIKLSEEHKKLLELSKDNNLGERESLRNQVKELTEKVQKQNETISSLQRRLLLEEKNHKRQLHLETVKHKEAQQQLANALSQNSSIDMKDKFCGTNSSQRKLFPKINSYSNSLKLSSNLQHQDSKYKEITSSPVYSPKDNESSEVSLDSNLKFSSSSTFSVVGKSLHQDSHQMHQHPDNPVNQHNMLSNKLLVRNERADPVGNVMNNYKNNTDLDLNEAIRVGIPNMSISESDTDPPRSSDDDIRERVENMKKQIRKSHRNDNEMSFEDVRSMMEMDNKTISRGTLSITSDDSSNGQLTLQQIDQVLLGGLSRHQNDLRKNNENSSGHLSFPDLDTRDSMFNTLGNQNHDGITENGLYSGRKNGDTSILHDYISRRGSNDYDSDSRSLDAQFWNNQKSELNNNSIGIKEVKNELDQEKKRKLLAALKAIDRGEDQGLLFSTSKRNSLSSRKNSQK